MFSLKPAAMTSEMGCVDLTYTVTDGLALARRSRLMHTARLVDPYRYG